MTQWIKEIQFVKKIANQLLSPRKTMYYDDYLIYKLSQNTHLRHRNFKAANEYNQLLSATLIHRHQTKKDVCIIFLHGYGSNKQQGFSLIDYLPDSMDLCCFDFSSSGKSQGNINTYGLKQFRDIRTIICELKKDLYGYKKFILWGRSMGAVSSFLMSSSQQKIDEEIKKDIVYQVLDSPFSSFQAICYYQGKQAFKLPQPFISYGIDILKSSFRDNPPHLNPFNIDLVKIASKCHINTLFVYSEKDEIIPQQNTLSIIQKLLSSTLYEKLLISESHNSLRTHQTNLWIFRIVQKNYLKFLYNKNKNMIIFPNQSDSMTQNILKNSSFKKKIQVRKTQYQQKNIQNSPKQDTKQSQSTSGQVSLKQPVKKQKKYLEILSSLQNKAKVLQKHYQNRQNIQQVKKPNLGQALHQSYREIFRNVQKEKSSKFIVNHKNSFNEIHRLRRTRTLDFGDEEGINNFIENCQSLPKLKNISSFVSPNKTPKKVFEQTAQKSKNHKRALYCSLKKKNTSQFKFQKQGNQKGLQFFNFNLNNKV